VDRIQRVSEREREEGRKGGGTSAAAAAAAAAVPEGGGLDSSVDGSVRSLVVK
jgi:hypothetical protein